MRSDCDHPAPRPADDDVHRMTSDLVVDVDERFRLSPVSEVDVGQDTLVTITLEVIQAPPVLISASEVNRKPSTASAPLPNLMTG